MPLIVGETIKWINNLKCNLLFCGDNFHDKEQNLDDWIILLYKVLCSIPALLKQLMINEFIFTALYIPLSIFTDSSDLLIPLDLWYLNNCEDYCCHWYSASEVWSPRSYEVRNETRITIYKCYLAYLQKRVVYIQFRSIADHQSERKDFLNSVSCHKGISSEKFAPGDFWRLRQLSSAQVCKWRSMKY